jgi:hypothetical protein
MKNETTEDVRLQDREPSNSVLVHLITEKPRAYLFVRGCLAAQRPSDIYDLGFEAWDGERKRRDSIRELMTKEEHQMFDAYCRLRDD